MGQLFNPKLLAGLIAAGIMAFIAFILLSAYADDFRTGRDGRGHALSASAIGFKGIVRLVELAGGKSRLLRSEAGNDADDLLVVVLEPRTTARQLQALVYQRPDQPTLVVLPKWLAGPDPQHRGWVRIFGKDTSSPPLSALNDAKVSVDERNKGGAMARGVGELAGIELPVPREPQTLSSEHIRPLLRVPGGGTLIAAIGGQNVYVLADPDLMNNHGLKDPRTAQAALAILAHLNSADAKSVVFDVSLNGFGRKPSVFKLPFEPPFLSLTLALFLAALLAGLHGAFRFGPARREERAIALGKLALVENSAGLIQLARREHRAGPAYADLVRDSAALASGAPATLHGDALDAYLDRLTPADTASFSTLARQVRDAADRHELVRTARALFQWKKDNIR